MTFQGCTRAAAVGLVLALASTGASAQRGGGGMTGPGGVEGSVMGGASARALTPFEEFAGKLKLDEKTQLPDVQQVFIAAQREAGPIGVEMLQLRQKLLNVDLGTSTDDRKAVLDAYAAAAARMAAVEARTFAKVYAMLKPNQQSNAPQAFALLTGFFQTAGGGRGGRQ